MEKLLLYKIYQDDQAIYTREPQPFDKSEKCYRLSAGQNCYLKNVKTQEIFKTIIIPEYQLNRWIEEKYK